MKKFLFLLGPLITLHAFVKSDSSCMHPKTFFLPRSQSVNAARELVGWQTYINREAQCANYGAFSCAAEYTRSFKPDCLSDFLFGPAIHNGCMRISGSLVPDRGCFDLLADYFGLPQDYQSTLRIKPIIENFLADFDLYLGLDRWCANTYLRMHAPLVYTRWSLNPREKIINAGELPFPRGYMNINEVERSALPQNALQTLRGCTTFADMHTPLRYGKFSRRPLGKFGLSDVQLALGWNFCATQDAHAGFNIRGSLPTGNKPHGKFIFEPIVGNGGFWELGGGFTCHINLTENNCGSLWAFYWDINLTHLFNSKQRRSFDFINNGMGSRYTLLAHYNQIPLNDDGSFSNGHLSNLKNDGFEYAGNLLFAINKTTLCADVSIALQVDSAFKFSYICNEWQVDFGYDFWARSHEKVKPQQLQPNIYALKGDSFMYGVAVNATPELTTLLPLTPAQAAFVDIARARYPANAIALSASQDESATLFRGGNYGNCIGVDPRLNPGVDSAENALAQENGVDVYVFSPIPGAPDTNPIQTSAPVHFTTSENNDCCTPLCALSASNPMAMSHKLFFNMSYNWLCTQCTSPFLGIGGEIEFDGSSLGLSSKCCDCHAALNQWGIWIKGGFGF